MVELFDSLFSHERKAKRDINTVKEAHRQSILAGNVDDYVVGFYNGMELASSIIEDREPEYLYSVKNEPGEEQSKEETKRTVASGIIRK